MDRSTFGYDMLLVYSVIHCIRYGIQPPDGKKVNPQTRPAVMLYPQPSCTTEQPVDAFEAVAIQGLMSFHQRNDYVGSDLASASYEFCSLEKILSMSMPQFPSDGTYFTGLLERLDVLRSIIFDDGEGEVI